MRKFVAMAITLLTLSTAGAGVIYLPVQYEYGGAEKYYYGGNDPAVFARVERASQLHAVTRTGDQSTQPIRVYTDLLPYHSNAAVFAFTANDARNEAYRSVPRYFRKVDLRPMVPESKSAAEPKPAPTRGSGTIEIKPYVRPAADASPRRVLILPMPTAEQK